jgi:hypothetical protein
MTANTVEEMLADLRSEEAAMSPEELAAHRAKIIADQLAHARTNPYKGGKRQAQAEMPKGFAAVADLPSEVDGMTVAQPRAGVDASAAGPSPYDQMKTRAERAEERAQNLMVLLDATATLREQAEAERDAWKDQSQNPLLSDFARAISENRESFPAEIWNHIDALQKQIDFSANGKFGPVYSGPMVDTAFRRLNAADAEVARLTARVAELTELGKKYFAAVDTEKATKSYGREMAIAVHDRAEAFDRLRAALAKETGK